MPAASANQKEGQNGELQQPHPASYHGGMTMTAEDVLAESANAGVDVSAQQLQMASAQHMHLPHEQSAVQSGAGIVNATSGNSGNSGMLTSLLSSTSLGGLSSASSAGTVGPTRKAAVSF